VEGSSFYQGSYAEDAAGPHRGWLVGSFLDDGPRRTDDVEVKFWSFPDGPTEHPTKRSVIFEVTFVLSGVTYGHIERQPVCLRAGEYVAIPPGIENNLNERVEDGCSGLTVKAPSDPTAKTVVL
jgi:mannose-6-phosphate isomerase-like protein (cupin superfamily)